MANITANDYENPFGLSCTDLQFIDNLIGSLSTNSQHDASQNKTQKEPNDDYLPTSPDNSMNGMPNSPIRFQKDNDSVNALELCLSSPSGYSNFGTSPSSSNAAPIYFQDTDPSCHDFTFGSSVDANRETTTNRSANHSDTDANNCRADRPNPPGYKLMSKSLQWPYEFLKTSLTTIVLLTKIQQCLKIQGSGKDLLEKKKRLCIKP